MTTKEQQIINRVKELCKQHDIDYDSIDFAKIIVDTIISKSNKVALVNYKEWLDRQKFLDEHPEYYDGPL